MQIIQDHSQHLKIVTKSYNLYDGRFLHPPLIEITVMHNLMQSRIRDFFYLYREKHSPKQNIYCGVP